MGKLPSFDEIVTREWFKEGLERGNFNPGHGSDIGEMIADIQHGVSWLPKCSDHLKDIEIDEAFDNKEMQSLIWQWLEKRYAHVVDNLPKDNPLKLYRVMRVEDEWISLLKEGDVTTGIYFSSDEYVDGGFWLDQEKPNEILLEVTVDQNDVDWHGTILARMDYLTGDSEAEIRMKLDVPVMVNSLTFGDDRYEIRKVLSTGQRWIEASKEIIQEMTSAGYGI